MLFVTLHKIYYNILIIFDKKYYILYTKARIMFVVGVGCN